MKSLSRRGDPGRVPAPSRDGLRQAKPGSVHALAALLLLATASAGCKPDLGAPQSLIIGPTILAIRGTPPESAEGGMATYDALTVDVTGTVAAPAIDWALCLAPNPPANGNDVADACLTIPDDTTTPAPTFTATLSSNACTLFGPDAPPPMKGQPPMRPADPDTTGGFYQLVRATWQSDAGPLLAFALQRSPAGSQTPPPISLRRMPPTTPEQEPDAGGSGARSGRSGDAARPHRSDERSTSGDGRGRKEGHAASRLQRGFGRDAPVLERLDAEPGQERESLRLSWFATGGAFEHDATGRSQTEMKTFTQNVWTAPMTPGPVNFWVCRATIAVASTLPRLKSMSRHERELAKGVKFSQGFPGCNRSNRLPQLWPANDWGNQRRSTDLGRRRRA